MAVGVIDRFEAVEIAHQQAARHTLLLVGGDEHRMHAVELGPVGHLGQRVFRGLFIEALAALFQRGLAGGVVEQQDRALGNALLVDHGNGVRIDGHGPLTAPENCQTPQRLHAAANGRLYGTVGLGDGRRFSSDRPNSSGCHS